MTSRHGWLPVADRRVERRVLAAAEPEVGHDGLARRMEGEAVRHRQAAPGLSVVLAEREEGDVRLEEVERVLPLLVQLDLELHGIGLQVDEAAGLVVLRPRLGAAVEVDDQLGRRVQAPQLALAHPVEPPVVVQRLVGPASAEAEPLAARRR